MLGNTHFRTELFIIGVYYLVVVSTAALNTFKKHFSSELESEAVIPMSHLRCHTCDKVAPLTRDSDARQSRIE